jgi:hypothetical protein
VTNLTRSVLIVPLVLTPPYLALSKLLLIFFDVIQLPPTPAHQDPRLSQIHWILSAFSPLFFVPCFLHFTPCLTFDLFLPLSRSPILHLTIVISSALLDGLSSYGQILRFP